MGWRLKSRCSLVFMAVKLEVFNSLPEVQGIHSNKSHFGWEELQVIVSPGCIGDTDFLDWGRSLPTEAEKERLVEEIVRVEKEDWERDEVGRKRWDKEKEQVGKWHQEFQATHGGRSLLEIMLDTSEIEIVWTEMVKKSKRRGRKRIPKIGNRSIIRLYPDFPDGPAAS